MNDYYISFPKLTDLTYHQQLVVNDPNPVYISGLAGTGKSVCLIYRYINLLKQYSDFHYASKNYAYITFTKTLVSYTRRIIKQNKLSTASINTASSFCRNDNTQQYDEIIIDEAQDLTPHQFRTVISKGKIIRGGGNISAQCRS